MCRISALTLPRKDSIWAYIFEKASGWDRFESISRAQGLVYPRAFRDLESELVLAEITFRWGPTVSIIGRPYRHREGILPHLER